MGQSSDFGLVAGRFCAFVDDCDVVGRAEFIRQLERELIALYDAALWLPEGNPGGPEPDEVGIEKRRALEECLSRKFSDRDGYWLVFDPYDYSDTTPVVGSLADDIADIYFDLSEGLRIIQRGEPFDAAAWQWRFTFDSHWGTHVVHALSAVRALRRANR